MITGDDDIIEGSLGLSPPRSRAGSPTAPHKAAQGCCERVLCRTELPSGLGVPVCGCADRSTGERRARWGLTR
jgi:hypothetical protein